MSDSPETNPIKIVEKTFSISNLRSSIIGGTFVGLNTNVGSSALSNNGCFDYLNLFPELASIEKDNGNAFDNIGLSTIWNVGFAATNEKISTPDYFGGLAIKYLKNRKLKTVDQIFSRRSENSVAALFGCFKMNGSKKTVIQDATVDFSSDLDELVRYGLICSDWLVNPQTIYYYASVDGQAKNQDYLYLIGGDDPRFFNPQELLKNLIKILKHLNEMDKTEFRKSIPQDVKQIYDTITQKDKIWCTYDVSQIPSGIRNHQVIVSALMANYFNRSFHGVFNFYNYLIHAKKHLNMQYIMEVNTTEKKIKIDDLIKSYSEVYNFCKNITIYQYNGAT